MTVTQHFDFLDAETHTALRAAADQAAWIRDDRPKFRSAAICTEWDGFALFLARAAERHPIFRRPLFEVQLTRMVDGESFGAHQDAQYGAEDDSAALTTFVYYLGDKVTFTGGRLLAGDDAVEPVDNSLVLFDGLAPHSIELIQGLGARRLTINGCYKNP